MRLTRLLCFLVILGSLAVAANAQTPVDPVIRTNSTGFAPGDPACGSTVSGVYYLCGNTLTEDYLTATFPIDFVNNNATNLTYLYLVFTDVPDGPPGPPAPFFQCFTNIWTDCSYSGGPTTTFYMYDDPTVAPLCQNNGNPGGDCPGFLAPGYEAQTTQTPLVSDIPEPDSIILFSTGLIALYVGTKRRIRSRA